MNYEKNQSRTKNSRKELIEEWSKLYSAPLSETEYLEICRNAKGFFDTLRKWNKNEGNDV